jgi:hypothetical protein
MAVISLYFHRWEKREGEGAASFKELASAKDDCGPAHLQSMTANFIILYQYIPAGSRTTSMLTTNTKKRECHH